MNLLRDYALSFVGTEYHYSGDDPLGGFDCSGFVQELLKSAGVVSHNTSKMNAQMLFDLLEPNSVQNAWALGSIAFFGESLKKISHIGFCLDAYRMIEAGGGDSDTVTHDVAIKRNAFVRIRPIKYRKDFLLVMKPSYATIGVI